MMNIIKSHMLLAGATGSGKSYCENILIKDLIAEGNADLILIDPKRVELRKFRNEKAVIRYAASAPDGDVSDCLDALEMAYDMMQFRFTQMEKEDAVEYSGNPLYVFLDEVAQMVYKKSDKKITTNLLYQISSLGRAAKVFVIVCTQRSTADVLDRGITSNLETVVCLRQKKPIDSRELIGIPDACHLPKIGYCYLSCPDLSRPVKVQTEKVWERLREVA